MSHWSRSVVLLASLAVSSCAGAKVTSTIRAPYVGPPIQAIAISPGGGVLGEAVAVELFNRGYRVIDPGQTTQLAGRYNLDEFEIGGTRSLEVLRDEGIDALLIVKSVSGQDGKPESASARVVSTSTGEVVAGLSWKNGWCGAPGSPCDRSKRKDASEAAVQIAGDLGRHLRR